MIVPPNAFQCTQCTQDLPTVLKCESCHGAMHLDCSTTVWVIRIGEECAHQLCKSCAGEDDEDEQ